MDKKTENIEIIEKTPLYPKWVKSKSGFTIIQITNRFEYVIVTCASDQGDVRYSYDKVHLPTDRPERFSGDPEYDNSNIEEFKNLCLKYADFSQRLSIAIKTKL